MRREEWALTQSSFVFSRVAPLACLAIHKLGIHTQLCLLHRVRGTLGELKLFRCQKTHSIMGANNNSATMMAARKHLRLATNARHKASANLKAAQSVFDAAQVASAVTRQALVAVFDTNGACLANQRKRLAVEDSERCNDTTDIEAQLLGLEFGIKIDWFNNVKIAKTALDNANKA